MAKVKVNNIVRFSQGATARKGILDVSMNVEDGDHLSNIDEGNLYPTGADNIGTPGRFPVTGAVNMEDIALFLTMLTANAANLTFLGKAHGSNNNELFTVINGFFDRGTLELSRQADARASLNMMAYSADGTTIPFTRASSVDTSGAATAKVKTNNIVSLTHSAIGTPGVLRISISVTRGTFIPNFDEGEMYPIGADNVGTPTPGYPVEFTLGMENMQAASAVGGAVDDLVVVAKAAAGASNQTITLSNARCRTGRSNMRRQADGSVELSGFCYASSGTALPITIA